jgi:hypothetical protein
MIRTRQPHRTQLRTISMILTFDNKFDQIDEVDCMQSKNNTSHKLRLGAIIIIVKKKRRIAIHYTTTVEVMK